MAIMQHQNHLALAFGILGNVISGLVFLAPVPTFYRIYKKKSTEGFQSLPYLVALFSSTLWLFYAFVKKDAFLLITINSMGCFIETIYIILFLIYATRDARILTAKLFMALNVGSFIMILVTIQYILHEHSIRVKVLGWMCTSFAVCVFVAPLSIVVEVVRTKSVEFMPIYLSLSLTISAIVWFFYGFSLKDKHIVIPNVLGFGLGLIQIILYIIYRDARAKNTEVMEEELTIEAIIVNPLGNTTFEQKIEGEEEEEKDVSRAKEEEEPTIESIIVTTPLGNPTPEGHPVSVDDIIM